MRLVVLFALVGAAIAKDDWGDATAGVVDSDWDDVNVDTAGNWTDTATAGGAVADNWDDVTATDDWNNTTAGSDWDDATAGGSDWDDGDNWDDSTAGGSDWDATMMHEEHHDNHFHHCAEGEHQEHHCKWGAHGEECYESCVTGCDGPKRHNWNQDLEEDELLCFEGEHEAAHEGHCQEGKVATWMEGDHGMWNEICMDAHPKPECAAGTRSMWGEGHEVCVPAGNKMECQGYKVHYCDHEGCQEFCNNDESVYKQKPVHGTEYETWEMCNWDDGEREMWKDNLRYCVHYEQCAEGMGAIHAERQECFENTEGDKTWTECRHWWGRVCAKSHERPRCPPGQIRSWDHQKQMEYCAHVGEETNVCDGGFNSHHCDQDGCSEYCIKHAEKQQQDEWPAPEEGCNWDAGEEHTSHHKCEQKADGTHECWDEEFCVKFHPCPDGEMGVWGGRHEYEGEHDHGKWWHGKVCVTASEHPGCPAGSRREWDDHMHEERCVEQGHVMFCDGFRAESCDHKGCHTYCVNDAFVPGISFEEPKHDCDWEEHAAAGTECWECDWNTDGMEMTCDHDGCRCTIYDKCGEHSIKSWAQRPDGSWGPVCMDGHRLQGCPTGSFHSEGHHDREMCIGSGYVLQRRAADKREFCNHHHSDLGLGNDGCCTVEFPCGFDEGDCDSDDQCHEGLVCGAPCSWNYENMEGGPDQCCGHPPEEEITGGTSDEDWKHIEDAAIADLHEDALNGDMDTRQALKELADWYINLTPVDHGKIEAKVKEHDGDHTAAFHDIAEHYGFHGVKKDALLRMVEHLQDEANMAEFEGHMMEGGMDHESGAFDMAAGVHHAAMKTADLWEEQDQWRVDNCWEECDETGNCWEECNHEDKHENAAVEHHADCWEECDETGACWEECHHEDKHEHHDCWEECDETGACWEECNHDTAGEHHNTEHHDDHHDCWEECDETGACWEECEHHDTAGEHHNTEHHDDHHDCWEECDETGACWEECEHHDDTAGEHHNTEHHNAGCWQECDETGACWEECEHHDTAGEHHTHDGTHVTATGDHHNTHDSTTDGGETFDEKFEEAEKKALEDLHDDANHTDASHREVLKDIAHWYMTLNDQDHAAIKEVVQQSDGTIQHAAELIADHFQLEGVKREAFMRFGKHLEEEMAAGNIAHPFEYDPSAHVEHVAGQWENEHHNTEHHNTGCWQECDETGACWEECEHHDLAGEHHNTEHHDDHKFGEDESCHEDTDCKSGLQCNTPCSWNTHAITEKCCGPTW